MKEASAYIVGPLVWLCIYFIMITISIAAWGIDPTAMFGTWFIPYIASAIGTIVSFLAMEKLNPNLSSLKILVIITLFVLFWIGSALASAVYYQANELIEARGIALLMCLVGVITAARIYNKD